MPSPLHALLTLCVLLQFASRSAQAEELEKINEAYKAAREIVDKKREPGEAPLWDLIDWAKKTGPEMTVRVLGASLTANTLLKKRHLDDLEAISKDLKFYTDKAVDLSYENVILKKKVEDLEKEVQALDPLRVKK